MQVVFVTLQAAFGIAIFLLVQEGAAAGGGPDPNLGPGWDNLGFSMISLV